MRKTAVAVFVLYLVWPVTAQRARGENIRSEDIREERPEKGSVLVAPAECTQIVRDLIRYLSRAKPDIGSDRQAQERWLSRDLRRALQHRQEIYEEYEQRPGTEPEKLEEPPSNNDLLGTWEKPTSYYILASRRVDYRVIIDIVFKWGKDTNYAGDQRLASYDFIKETGGWKLDDIYTHRGQFVEAGSLIQTFRRQTYP